MAYNARWLDEVLSVLRLRQTAFCQTNSCTLLFFSKITVYSYDAKKLDKHF
jgi:hypothetical protein